MSSQPLSELWPPAVAAEEIDYELQVVAESLPEHFKFAAAGIPQLIVENNSRDGLYSIYLGEFRLCLAVKLARFDQAFCKDYDLIDHHIKKGGVLHEQEMTRPEDFECAEALPSTELVIALKSLRQAYMQQDNSEGVVYLDDYR